MNKNTPEIFSDFEAYKCSRAPIMMKLLGASIVLHFAFIASAIFIPVVRDLLFIAHLLEDTGFIDADYKRTKIGEIVDVIDLDKDGKFVYPEGYFYKEKPVVKVEEKPKPKPTPKPQPKKSKAEKNKTEVAKNDGDKGDQTESDGEDNYGPVSINKRPLKDFGADVKVLVEEGKLDLEQPFEIVITGGLNARGRLTGANYRVINGGKEMGQLGAGLILALNDSGLFAQLVKANDGKPLKSIVFNVKRDSANYNVVLTSKVESADKAATIARSLGLVFTLVKAARSGKDEAILMQQTKANASGDKFIVNFRMPNAQADAMIQRQLTLAKRERG